MDVLRLTRYLRDATGNMTVLAVDQAGNEYPVTQTRVDRIGRNFVLMVDAPEREVLENSAEIAALRLRITELEGMLASPAPKRRGRKPKVAV